MLAGWATKEKTVFWWMVENFCTSFGLGDSNCFENESVSLYLILIYKNPGSITSTTTRGLTNQKSCSQHLVAIERGLKREAGSDP